MRFQEFRPSLRLQPFIQRFVIAENEEGHQYKVFPSVNIVIGLQFSGKLVHVTTDSENNLSTAGITGLSDTFKVFRSSANTGSVLIYFSEAGLAAFCKCPAHYLANASIALDSLFTPARVSELEERLCQAADDQVRILVVERFLLAHLQPGQQDFLIIEAVNLVKASGGNIRMSELQRSLYISASPFEKRFRQAIGISPKKFASIVRFTRILQDISNRPSLTDVAYQHSFYDQAHFIKEFKRLTGDTPENFKRTRQ